MLVGGETIVTAYAESVCGPGWANSPIWVIIREPGGGLRMDTLQPNEQTKILRCLYSLSEETHRIMLEQLKDAEVKR